MAVRTLVLSSSAAGAQAVVQAMSWSFRIAAVPIQWLGTSIEAWNDLMTDVHFGTSLLSS